MDIKAKIEELVEKIKSDKALQEGFLQEPIATLEKLIGIDLPEEQLNVCPCGYVYDPAAGDPDNGVAPGTPWEQVPEDWVCPVCGLGKDSFEKE